MRGRKGEYRDLIDEIKREGFIRARIDGKLNDLEQEIKLKKNIKHNIEVVVDRLKIRPDIRQRLSESVEVSLKMGSGLVIIENVDEASETPIQRKICLHEVRYQL